VTRTGRWTACRLGAPAPGVARLTLCRPPVNALDAESYDGLVAALGTLGEDADMRALVIDAAGERAFSAGSDLQAFGEAEPYERIAAAARRFFTALAAVPVPVVGALAAPAVGGGAMIAAECDVLLAAPGVYFSVPEVSMGVPGSGSHVKRLAPYFKVQRMMLLGERLSAEEALAFGTVARLVPRADLDAAALEAAKRIASLDPGTVRAARAIFRAPESAAALAGYEAEMEAAVRLITARSSSATSA
jgi:enoyl-CoA hydratase